MIPYALIGQIVLKLIDFFARRESRKVALKKQMLEFIEKYDKSALSNARIRYEYEDLIRRSKEEVKD